MAAERRTREASSAGVRAPEISSLASSPKTFRTLLENPLSTTMAGLKTAVKTSCGRATALPIGNDSAMAMFFGTSSPISMDSSVASVMARTRDTEPVIVGRDPDGGQRPFEQLADGGLHHVAGQQGGQGDAQLAAGQLGGQGFEALQQRLGGGVAVVHGALDRGLVQGYEGELDGHKEAGAKDEQQARCKEYPFHSAACFRRAG